MLARSQFKYPRWLQNAKSGENGKFRKIVLFYLFARREFHVKHCSLFEYSLVNNLESVPDYSTGNILSNCEFTGFAKI